MDYEQNLKGNKIGGIDTVKKSGQFSRRDFIKLGGAALLGVAAAELLSLKPTSEYEILPIVTKNANIYPMFERHDERKNYSTELSKIGVTPDVHFVEMVMATSASDFQMNANTNEILFWESTSPSGKKSAYFDAQTIVDFANNSVDVAYEGIKQIDIKPSSFANRAVLIERTLVTALTSALEASSLNVGQGTKDKLWDFQNQIVNSNPDDLGILFRNCLIARKLQTLSNYYSEQRGRSANVSFGIGFAHQGITTLLEGGEESTLAMFSGFSNEVLQSIVDENGGIGALCNTLIVPVKDVIVDKNGSKNIIADIKLKNLLTNKLSEVKVVPTK